MQRSYWNPYIVGSGIGVLSWVVFVVVDAPLGMSTAISQAAGAAATPFWGAREVAANPYWAATAPAWDYGTLFLAGTLLGAFLSALISKTFKLEYIPTLWSQRFGDSVTKRALAAFIGGVVALYGARLAGGCTSGHGISGSLQLALSSWVFFIVMFLSGVITAQILYRKRS